MIQPVPNKMWYVCLDGKTGSPLVVDELDLSIHQSKNQWQHAHRPQCHFLPKQNKVNIKIR